MSLCLFFGGEEKRIFPYERMMQEKKYAELEERHRIEMDEMITLIDKLLKEKTKDNQTPPAKDKKNKEFEHQDNSPPENSQHNGPPKD